MQARTFRVSNGARSGNAENANGSGPDERPALTREARWPARTMCARRPVWQTSAAPAERGRFVTRVRHARSLVRIRRMPWHPRPLRSAPLQWACGTGRPNEKGARSRRDAGSALAPPSLWSGSHRVAWGLLPRRLSVPDALRPLSDPGECDASAFPADRPHSLHNPFFFSGTERCETARAPQPKD